MAVIDRHSPSRQPRRPRDVAANGARLAYDPQGYEMGWIGAKVCQASLVVAMVWGMGALKGMFLPTTLGLLPLLMISGALLLAPRSVLMQFPVSLSILANIGIIVASVMWTIDEFASTTIVRGVMPSILTMILAAGLLTMKDLSDGLLWGVRVIILITMIALVIDPSTRTHVSDDIYLPDYPGWHGFFIHKNDMSPVLVFGIATVMTFDKYRLTRWGTLGLIGVLLLGSTSATGLSAGFFAVIAWYWLRIFRGQRDQRNSSLFLSITVLGFLGMMAVVIASVATVTSAYGKDTSFSGRTEIWEAVLQFISARPLLGYGYGAMFWRNPANVETAEIVRLVGFPAAHAHNGFLDVAIQVGLVGAGFFLVLFVTTTRTAWSRLERQPEIAQWALVVIAGNGLMSFSESVYSGGWLGIFAIMKIIFMRREVFLGGPPRRIFSDVGIQRERASRYSSLSS